MNKCQRFGLTCEILQEPVVSYIWFREETQIQVCLHTRRNARTQLQTDAKRSIHGVCINCIPWDTVICISVDKNRLNYHQPSTIYRERVQLKDDRQWR